MNTIVLGKRSINTESKMVEIIEGRRFEYTVPIVIYEERYVDLDYLKQVLSEHKSKDDKVKKLKDWGWSDEDISKVIDKL